MQQRSAAEPDTRVWRVTLAVVTLGALVLRIVYVLVSKNPRAPGGDAFYFHFGANFLVDGKGFIDPIALLLEHHHVPGAVHPPGYILFLAISTLFGFRSFLDHQIWSCLLGAGTVALMGVTGREIAGRRVGLIAAAIAAIYPNFWFHDSVVMSETMIMFTTALVILLAYRVWRAPTLARAVVLGVAVGLAILTRAESVLLVVTVALPLAYILRAASRRVRAGVAGAMVGAALLTIAPWVIFNLTRFEHPVTLSTNLDATVASANCRSVYYGEFIGFWAFRCVTSLHPPQGDGSVRAVYYRKKWLDFVRHHESRVPLVVLEREGRTWAFLNPIQQVTLDEIEGEEAWLTRAGLAMFYVLAIAGVGGAVVLRRRRVTLIPVLGVIAAVAVTVGAVYGTTRFRTPAEVPITLLAAVGLDALIGVRHRRARPSGRAERDGARAPAAPAP